MGSSWVFGQQDLNQTVQVSREYEARLMTAVKPTLPVRYADSLARFRLRFDYQFSERPYRDLYEFTPVHFASHQAAGRVVYPTVFANLALAYPWLPEADLYIQPNLGERWSWVVYGNHRSFWGTVPGQSVDLMTGQVSCDADRTVGDRMTNRVGTRGGYAWKRGEVHVGFDFENNHRTFEGAKYSASPETELPDQLSHRFNKLSADLCLRSAQADRRAFYYDVDLRYIQTRQHMNQTVSGWNDRVLEDLVEGAAEIGMTFEGDHRVILGVKSVNSLAAERNGILEVVPAYRFERGRWMVDAGMGLAGMYTTSEQDLDLTHFYPKVQAYYEAVRDKLWVYARLDGENVLNTWSSLFDFNPWMTQGATVLVTHVPVRAKLGAQGVLWNVFTYNAGLSYADIKNRLTATANLFQPVQYDSHVGRLSAMASLLLKTKNVEAGLELTYSQYYQESNKVSQTSFQTLMAPAWEGHAFFRYNLRERFVLSAEADYRSSVYAQMGKACVCQLPGYLDLQARISYVFNRKMTFYLNGGNLLDAAIQHVPGYLEPGINFGLGVCYKF